ncbi:MAG: alkaline shock response membrane anchor protein AmaP [Oscillospiraceae bacterium]|jgi:uncharacterized alkaline shock family protein YloU|nr:alkaline shock response membrane anchor protein AmaP [Oscillospiraceae bacterium]
MRIRWYDRVLIALSGLLLLALGLLLIMTGIHEPKPVYDFGIKLTQAFLGLTVVHWIREGLWYVLAVMIAAGLAISLWGVRQWISLIPRRKHETFFAATQIDRGTLSIARPALEHLVQKCVSEHPEMSVSKINISSENDKAMVRMRATMRSGVSMPKATAALKKEIVEYISECAGIEVSNVQVIVEDTTPPLTLTDGVSAAQTGSHWRSLPGQTDGSTARLPAANGSASEPAPIIAPEPEAIPIPLGSIVDDEPAVPVMASISFPDIAREADETDPIKDDGGYDDESAIDPMFSMDSRVAADPVNGEEDEGDVADASKESDSNAVRS